MTLKGKTALVTGSSSGIGKAIADTFERVGVKVEPLCRTYGTDLTDTREANYFFDNGGYTGTTYHYDIVVNCAGSQSYGNAEDIQNGGMDYQLDLMANAPLQLCRRAFPHMKSNAWGRIINITSVAAHTGTRRTIGYAAAKHALHGITQCLSNEWASYGITVNSIAPGFIDTEMLKPLTDDKKHLADMVGRIPMERLGTPQEVANVALFLASEQASYVTGSTIFVDGGWMGR